MPKPIGSEKDQLVVNAAIAVIEGGEANCPYASMRSRLEEDSPSMAYDARKRWLLLSTAARAQVFDLVYGMHRVLDLSGQPVGRLRDTAAVGHRFGKISDHHLTRMAPQVKDYPFQWLDWSDEYQQIALTEKCTNYLRKHSDRETGCSALALTVRVNGVEQYIYDHFWRIFTAQYIASYGKDNTGYVTPPVFEPNF